MMAYCVNLLLNVIVNSCILLCSMLYSSNYIVLHNALHYCMLFCSNRYYCTIQVYEHVIIYWYRSIHHHTHYFVLTYLNSLAQARLRVSEAAAERPPIGGSAFVFSYPTKLRGFRDLGL